MFTATLVLVLLSASCLAQQGGQLPLPASNATSGSVAQQEGQSSLPNANAPNDTTCDFQPSTITCDCRKGNKVTKLTSSFMEGGGRSEAGTLKVIGCESVTFVSTTLRNLHTLSVSGTGSVIFQEQMPQLQHLTLVNVTQVTFQGSTFHNASLETVSFDGVQVGTLPSKAFAGLSKLRKVSFKNVRINAVQENAVEVEMVSESNFIIENSQLLGVQKGGIILKGVVNFTMSGSDLTTLAEDALHLASTGYISISDSKLKPAGPLKIVFPSSSHVRFVRNVWQGPSMINLFEQLLYVKANLDIQDNKFHCTCDSEVQKLISNPENPFLKHSLLDENDCDTEFCGKPAKLRVITGCYNETLHKAACEVVPTSPHTGNALTVSAAPATPSVFTNAPRAAQPKSPTVITTPTTPATATVITVTTALLLTAPAAAALAL